MTTVTSLATQSFIATIGFLVDPPAICINVTGDTVSAMLLIRVVEGGDWMDKHPEGGSTDKDEKVPEDIRDRDGARVSWGWCFSRQGRGMTNKTRGSLEWRAALFYCQIFLSIGQGPKPLNKKMARPGDSAPDRTTPQTEY